MDKNSTYVFGLGYQDKTTKHSFQIQVGKGASIFVSLQLAYTFLKTVCLFYGTLKRNDIE